MTIDTAYTEIERLVKNFKALSAPARKAFNEDNTRKDYSGPRKLDTETGYLKVYNYQHAQTLLADSESQSCSRTAERRKAVDANCV